MRLDAIHRTANHTAATLRQADLAIAATVREADHIIGEERHREILRQTSRHFNEPREIVIVERQNP